MNDDLVSLLILVGVVGVIGVITRSVLLSFARHTKTAVHPFVSLPDFTDNEPVARDWRDVAR